MIDLALHRWQCTDFVLFVSITQWLALFHLHKYEVLLSGMRWFNILAVSVVIPWEWLNFLFMNSFVIVCRSGSKTDEPNGGRERKLWVVTAPLRWWRLPLLSSRISPRLLYTTRSCLELRLTQWRYRASIHSLCSVYTAWWTSTCYSPHSSSSRPPPQEPVHQDMAVLLQVCLPQQPALLSNYPSVDSHMHSLEEAHHIILILPSFNNNKTIDCFSLLLVRKNTVLTLWDLKQLNSRQITLLPLLLSSLLCKHANYLCFFLIFFGSYRCMVNVENYIRTILKLLECCDKFISIFMSKTDTDIKFFCKLENWIIAVLLH